MKRETYRSIVKASGIEKGDLVLIQNWMEDTISEDVGYLQAEIAAVGATPILMIQNLKISQLVNENITDTTYGDKYFRLFEAADVVIDLMERPIGILLNPLEPEKMDLLRAYMRKLFQVCSSRKKMLQLRVPTATMAKEEGMDAEEYRNRMEVAMAIDYSLLKDARVKLKKEVENYQGVTLVTGNGEHRLELSFEGREWDMDAGDGDLPCGEICIAPVECKTNGTVYFETIYLPDSEVRGKKQKFENVILTVENGVITSTNQEELTALLMEGEEANRVVCEFGIGMNPNVTSLCGCALLDEKMMGTFHLGIGDNVMFGGENEADDHEDLIGKGDFIWKK